MGDPPEDEWSDGVRKKNKVSTSGERRKKEGKREGKYGKGGKYWKREGKTRKKEKKRNTKP